MSIPALPSQAPGKLLPSTDVRAAGNGSTGRMEKTSWHTSDTHPRDWNGRLSPPPHSKSLLHQKRSKASLKLDVLLCCFSLAEVGGQRLEPPQAPPWSFFELGFPALICHCKKSFPAVRSTLSPSDPGPHHHIVPLQCGFWCPQRFYPKSWWNRALSAKTLGTRHAHPGLGVQEVPALPLSSQKLTQN